MVKEKQAKAFVGFFKKQEKKEEKPRVEAKPGFGIPFQVIPSVVWQFDEACAYGRRNVSVTLCNIH